MATEDELAAHPPSEERRWRDVLVGPLAGSVEPVDAASLLGAALANVGEGVIYADTEGYVRMMSSVAERLTGCGEATARGTPLADVFCMRDERTGRPSPLSVDAVLGDGSVVSLAERTVLVGADGLETPISGHVAPVRGGDGRVHGLVLVFRDVGWQQREGTHRAFLVEVTRVLASSLHYRETLAHVAEIAVPSFADWCAVSVLEDGATTPSVVSVAHKDPSKDWLARTWAERYLPDWSAPRGAGHVLRTGRSDVHLRITDEMLIEIARDEEHLALLRILDPRSALFVPISDGHRVLGVLTLALTGPGRRYREDDVELLEEVGRRAGVAIANARLYAAEQRAREAADSANRIKDEFLATVSHELRTPLGAILGWAQLAKNGLLDPGKLVRATAAIERNASAMADLVEDLLDVSRMNGGKMRLELGSVDLGQVSARVLESLAPAAAAKDIRLSQTGSLARPVIGDESRLRQVVSNLLSNALKFTAQGGSVSVALCERDGFAELKVEDTGKGISPAFLPHVFDPFLQSDGTGSRKSGGLGLGLSIAQRIVELHGGQIEAASDGDGKGATFTVRLPLAAEAAAGSTDGEGSEPGSESVPPPPPVLRGLKVLVVDDDAASRQIVQTILEAYGSVVTTADGAESALAAFEREVPDVLLSDIGMPGQDGYDLIQTIRMRPVAAGGTVPAAALTAYTRADDRDHALAAGFMMHVPKPVDAAELVAVVTSLVRMAAERSQG